MWWVAAVVGSIGLLLSALFSGSETGFYRASRLKIAMDAQEGDRLSRLLKSFTNQTGAFISTVLIGNNCANYLVSFALVLLTQQILSSHSVALEILATLLMTPIVFVYGELLPKTIFFQAPNRLLRSVAPLLLCFALLLAPVILILWGLSRFTEWVFGRSPERVSMALAREELQRALDEGQQIGILHRSQRLLAQNFAEAASRPIRAFLTPLPRVASVIAGSRPQMAIRVAQQNNLALLPIANESRTELIGYIQLAELLIVSSVDQKLAPIQELVDCRADEPVGEVILRMQTQRQSMARVVNQQRETIGIVTLDQLIEPLLKGPLGTLKR
ncbi:MAG TPA: CNNM domain-containing protein [Pirellulaceae bacterium]|nr:CNNM domain-containing protein [Pirellulaceae bacterium]